MRGDGHLTHKPAKPVARVAASTQGATATRGAPTLKATAQHPFHAIEICSGAGACPAAQHCVGIRFLSRESPPTLPMRYCDRPGQCTCRYRHHDDRRAGPRRSAENGRPSQPWPQSDRRMRRGRRIDD